MSGEGLCGGPGRVCVMSGEDLCGGPGRVFVVWGRTGQRFMFCYIVKY